MQKLGMDADLKAQCWGQKNWQLSGAFWGLSGQPTLLCKLQVSERPCLNKQGGWD